MLIVGNTRFPDENRRIGPTRLHHPALRFPGIEPIVHEKEDAVRNKEMAKDWRNNG